MSAPPGDFEFPDSVTSDLAVVARAPTLEGVFATMAEALLAATVERPEAVRPAALCRVDLEAKDLERLLMRFVNELIFLRDAEGLVLRAVKLSIDPEPRPHLRAELAGEPLDAQRHGSALDVKAATAHGLSLRSDADGWEAQLTLDV